MKNDIFHDFNEAFLMDNDELPEGWSEVPLVTILSSLESGSRPRGGVRGIDSGIPSVGGEHLNEFGGFRFENIKFIPINFFEKMQRGRIQTGDVLIVKDGATTGKVSLVRPDFPYNPAVVNEHVFICRFIQGIYSPFIFYFLFSQAGQNRILENFQGSAQGGINQSFAKNTIVPVAPLKEQPRIVTRVEALLSQVNAARDRLNRVPLIMKRFRQAVLAAACSGRLTEGEYESDGNWSYTPFKNVLAKNPQNGVYLPQSHYGEGIPIIRIDDFHQGVLKSWHSLKRVNSPSSNLDRYVLKENDILINRVNSMKHLGKSVLIENIPEPTIFESNMMRVSLNKNFIYPHFAILYLQSSIGIEELRKNAKHAVNQSSINQKDICTTSIPIPPLNEQQEILHRVNALFALADQIEHEVAGATKRTEVLTQAILAKAFCGELVPTEAELARREGREYEPVSVLVERIQAGKLGMRK